MIEKGRIKNRWDSQIYPYIIRELNNDDILQIMDLQNFILSLMKDKRFCVPLSPVEHRQILGDDGETIGLFIQDKLYAVCSILSPGYREDNMARQLNFSDEELPHVAQLELSLVHPDLRGNNLQYKLADMLARRAKKKKNYRYLFTTVSPYNYPSIKTVTSLGLSIVKLCKMYYHWDRYVVYKDTVKPLELDKTNTVHVPVTLFEKQQELLSNGYYGCSQSKDKENIKIMFAKEVMR